MLRLFLIALVLPLHACDSFQYIPPLGTQPNVSVESPKGFDDTWQAVIEAFSETNTSIKTIEKVSGLVTAERMVLASEIDAA